MDGADHPASTRSTRGLAVRCPCQNKSCKYKQMAPARLHPPEAVATREEARMATGKVARRTAVSDVAELLDSPEISALIEELEALRWTGRKGFGTRALVGTCLIKAFYAIPTWTIVAALIAEHPGLQDALGACP